MTIKITAELLREHDACDPGLEDFEATYPDGLETEWTLEDQLAILRTPLRRWLGWAWQEGLLPAWSMACMDLSGARLDDADLRGAYLFGANLANAHLIGADLRGAYLFGADLHGASLPGAHLNNVDLRNTNLQNAYLFGASLCSANLRNADLRDAKLQGADLRDVQWNEYTTWPEGFRPEEAA